MAKWVNSDVLDFGINRIKTNANVLHLIKAYAAGDSYATVLGNSLASTAMAPGDYTLADGASSARTLTPATNGKTGTATASSGATPNLHFAFVDSAASKVLYVTDETTDQVITSGNPVNFPAGNPLVYTSNQPT